MSAYSTYAKSRSSIMYVGLHCHYIQLEPLSAISRGRGFELNYIHKPNFNPLMINVSKTGTMANNEDPDQTPQNAASDLGLHCLR